MEAEYDRTCLNCGHRIDLHYCPNCGQKATVRRYSARYLVAELVDSLDLNRGMLHTLWSLATRPGTAIRGFVLGKRVHFSNALKLFLVIGAVATFLTFRFRYFTVSGEPQYGFELPDWEGYYAYAIKYFTFVNSLPIPLFAVFSWLIFRESGFNYIENLVMNIYVAIGQFMLLIAMTPALISTYDFAIVVYGPLNFAYNVWVVMYFFNAVSFKGLFKSMLAVVIPQALSYFFNYGVYLLIPDTFLKWLDAFLN